jgi:DNA-binding transcriptional regulator YiaG
MDVRTIKKIYVFLSSDGPVKIGISVNPSKRRVHLERNGPASLTMVYEDSLPSKLASEAERIVKSKLEPHKRRGEWFSVSPDEAVDVVKEVISDIRRIAALCEPVKTVPTLRQEKGGHLREIRRGLGLNQGEWAKLVGVTRPTVSDWERGFADVPVLASRLADYLHKFPEELHGFMPELGAHGR